MNPVTAEQVKSAVTEAGVTKWLAWKCQSCHAPVGFAFAGEAVTYATSCQCDRVSGQLLVKETPTWDDVAGLLNNHGSGVRAMLWNHMLQGHDNG